MFVPSPGAVLASSTMIMALDFKTELRVGVETGPGEAPAVREANGGEGDLTVLLLRPHGGFCDAHGAPVFLTLQEHPLLPPFRTGSETCLPRHPAIRQHLFHRKLRRSKNEKQNF